MRVDRERRAEKCRGMAEMTDDLVERLREEATADTSTCSKLAEEAADRIEQLEAQLTQSQLKRWAARWEEQSDRIEKLEAALREIADIEHEDLPKPVGAAEGTLWVILAGCVEVAEKALEKKDD